MSNISGINSTENWDLDIPSAKADGECDSILTKIFLSGKAYTSQYP